MKKYKILWGNIPKIRSFVVVTAFFFKLEGGVLNKFNNSAFHEQAEVGILAKIPTWRITRGRGDPNVKKYKKQWGNTPKFNSFVVVTAFYLKLEGAFWINTIFGHYTGCLNFSDYKNSQKRMWLEKRGRAPPPIDAAGKVPPSHPL